MNRENKTYSRLLILNRTCIHYPLMDYHAGKQAVQKFGSPAKGGVGNAILFCFLSNNLRLAHFVCCYFESQRERHKHLHAKIAFMIHI